MSTPYVGEIRMFGFNFAPVNWALCEGQLVPISQNTVLFTLLGTTYGGDGVNTFGLPDFQGRIPIHQGQGLGLSSYNIGQRGGTENVTLSVAQIPSHTHTLLSSSGGTRTTAPSSTTALGSGEADIYNRAAVTSPLALASALGGSGQSQPHTNVQPITCVNFCISLYGVFPSQS